MTCPFASLGIDGLNGRARGLDEWRLNAANHLKADRDVLPATIHRVIIDICSQQSRGTTCCSSPYAMNPFSAPRRCRKARLAGCSS